MPTIFNEMKSLAPIIFFAYNRPDHTRQALEALSMADLADQSLLRIYIDGPKATASAETIAAIEQVKKVANEKKWCREVVVIAAEKNKGLFRSIVDGITDTVKTFGKVIVIEDDVVVSKGF